MKSFNQRLAALEQLEAAQSETAYACLHAADYAALTDPATPAATCQAIAEAYQLGGNQQKLYIGVCCCWGVETCRVCIDQPLVSEVVQ